MHTPQLDEWLEKINEGKLGLPTARTHAWFRHIGYPISQCLLRRTDRQKLPDFFQWARLDPKGEIGFEELIPLLRQWITRTTCTLSERGRVVFANADQELMKSAAEIVAAEFRVWDGSVEDVEGHRSIKMLLRLEVSSGGRRCICELYSPAPKDFPEGSYRAGTQNQNVNLSRLPHGEWFMPITGQQAMQALQYGLVLKKDKYALKFDTASVIILGEHDELGGWVSCSRVQFGEKHLVLCRTDYADGVTKYLEQYAKSGWEFVSTTQGLPPTWNIFRNVQIAAWPDYPTGELDCLCPRLHIGISLKHGLKVTRDTWFVDGAPTVVIVTPDRRPVAVYIDGHEIKSLSMGSGEISLADLNLTVGEHEVVVGKQSRRFQLSDTGYTPISGDTLGYVINRDEGRPSPVSLGTTVTSMPEQSSAHTIIVGARMFGLHVEETLTLTHGYKRYIILGRRPGEILEYQPKPGYLQDEVEIAVSFEPQWLIRVGRKGKEIRAVVPGTMPQAPEATIADQSRVNDWIQWARRRYHNLKSKHQQRALWEQYRQLAAELSNIKR